MNHAVILAGGSGTRFWPLSRDSMPKQFLAFGTREPLLRTTAERILPICGWDGLLVVGSEKHVAMVRKVLPRLRKANLMVEPQPRNTAPAIGLAAAEVISRDPEGVLVVLPSDQIIRPASRFRKLIRAACVEAKTEALVVLGVVPNRPETGYGYIQAGRKLRLVGGCQTYEVSGFTEKPDLLRAQEYLNSGNYFWNSGMFVFKASAIMRAFAAHMPQLYAGLTQAQAAPAEERPSILRNLFDQLGNLSIDYGVMEKASNIHMLISDFEWNDVGSWAALPEVLGRDESGNVVEGDVVALDSQGCVLHSTKRLVACVGLQDMVVVETEDAVLVCPLEEAQRVRLLVSDLRRRDRKDVL